MAMTRSDASELVRKHIPHGSCWVDWTGAKVVGERYLDANGNQVGSKVLGMGATWEEAFGRAGVGGGNVSILTISRA